MHLEYEQYELLAKFVEAHRSTPRESRGAFIASQTHDQPQATFLHSRVHGLTFQGSMSDAEILADTGLLRRSYGSRGTILFYVLPQGIDAYEKNKLVSPLDAASTEPGRSSGISVFISHSHQDVELVKKLITLLRSALNLSSSQLRATSVDGFRLPGGSNTNEQLRAEVQEAKVLIGVISGSSLKSAYVTFELGARWGSGKPMIPLLAPNVGPDSLAGPLQSINALSCRSSAQLHQFVEEIAGHLGLNIDRPAGYQKCVDDIIRHSNDEAERFAREAPSSIVRTDENANATLLGSYYGNPAFPVQGIHHISLPVRNLDASMGFYYDTLCLRQATDPEINDPRKARPDFGFPGVWFELPDGQQLHLVLNRKGKDEPVTFRKSKEVNFKDVHFAVRVQDYNAMYNIVKKRGAKIFPGPCEFQCYVLDPDSHVIEITGPYGPGPKRT